MPGLRHGLAVPCFADEPAGLIEFGVQAERAGFDGFFLWDHMVFADSGEGPPIADPWLVLAVVAARTSRIRIGARLVGRRHGPGGPGRLTAGHRRPDQRAR